MQLKRWTGAALALLLCTPALAGEDLVVEYSGRLVTLEVYAPYTRARVRPREAPELQAEIVIKEEWLRRALAQLASNRYWIRGPAEALRILRAGAQLDPAESWRPNRSTARLEAGLQTLATECFEQLFPRETVRGKVWIEGPGEYRLHEGFRSRRILSPSPELQARFRELLPPGAALGAEVLLEARGDRKHLFAAKVLAPTRERFAARVDGPPSEFSIGAVYLLRGRRGVSPWLPGQQGVCQASWRDRGESFRAIGPLADFLSTRYGGERPAAILHVEGFQMDSQGLEFLITALEAVLDGKQRVRVLAADAQDASVASLGHVATSRLWFGPVLGEDLRKSQPGEPFAPREQVEQAGGRVDGCTQILGGLGDD